MQISSRPELVVQPKGFARILAPRRVIFLLVAASAITLFLSIPWKSSVPSLFIRVAALAFSGLIVFGIFEVWPKRLPRWIARWVLQLLGIVFILPVGVFMIYTLSLLSG